VNLFIDFAAPVTRLAGPLARGLASGAWWVLAFGAAEVQGATMYLCPGNLFTNELDATRARAQSCRAVQADGLSQAVLTPVLKPALPPQPEPEPGSRAQALAPAQPRLRPPASRVALSRERYRAGGERPAAPARVTASQVDTGLQRERDRDAVAILQTELARTLAAQQALARAGDTAAAGPELKRLRADELALRRELDRHQR